MKEILVSIVFVATVVSVVLFGSSSYMAPALVYSSSSSNEHGGEEDEKEETAENSTTNGNQTGFTESQKFGLILSIVKSIPWACESLDEYQNDTELWQEACKVWEKYYR